MAIELPTGVIADPIVTFLDTIVKLHNKAVAIHNDHPHGDCDIVQLHDTLATTVERLRGKLSTDDANVLARTCVKLGQHLLIRVDRVQAAQGLNDASVDLRDVWPTAAIEVLGERIQDLQARWPVSTSPQPPVCKLSRITTTGAKEKNEETKKDIADLQPKDAAKQQNAPTSVAGMFGNGQVKPQTTKIAHRGPPADLLEDFILDSLAYKSMRDREEEVAEAHGKTFEWIFEPETNKGINHKFTTWLKTDDLGSIYWISGKPGSGKSTLMRFLFGHPSMAAYLKSWAGDLPISKAGFFFWTSGSKDQRSQTGLLRYLLHQLLSENRAMMPKAFPDLWLKLQTLTTKERIKLVFDWEAPELMRAFRSFIDAAVQHSKICLFVDGLDEFDGDFTELVGFFQGLGTGVHVDRVKMCLASRPWDVFERSFQSSVPNFKLQELSYQDMYHYVADRLNADQKVGNCLREHPALKETFFKEAVRRADGVFLWVRIIVSKLLKDFQPSQGIGHLQTIVRNQPTELDDLFEKLIFHDQNVDGLSETANIFQLITARETAASFVNDETANSLNVWEIALALDPEDDSVALSDDEVRQATDDEVQERCDNTCNRIDQRFMGLLGVFPHRQTERKRTTVTENEEDESQYGSARRVAGHKVTYVHRTIRDWLMEGDGVRGRLISKSPEGFDPDLRLLRAGILVLKLPVERPWRRRWLNDWWPQITMCMTHARNVQQDPSHLQRLLLHELDRTIAWYWIRRPGDPSDHWAKHMFYSYEERQKAPPIREPYLRLVTKFGIANYVEQELKDLVLKDSQPPLEPTANQAEEEEDLKQGGTEDDDEEDEEEDTREGNPILFYATEFLCSRQKSIYPPSSPTFVAALLQTPSRHNPGPNDVYIDFFPTGAQNTAWLAVLKSLRRAHRRGWIAHLDIDPQGTARWVEIVKLFLGAGADVTAIISADRWDPEISALGMLELLEREYCASEVSELRKLMAELKACREVGLGKRVKVDFELFSFENSEDFAAWEKEREQAFLTSSSSM
ncbi:hypothetical protein N431DRAFT_482087 [Stipitochalara longipes BDJ]|nr:hypothetical protein N431DRAFT_482087 [Stipitochalara longipes BDJ]